MKATDLLRKQHREVEALFRALQNEKGDAATLVTRLADALVAHMAIEQQLFYSSVKKLDPQLVYESFEEHAVIEVALKRLLECDPSEPNFRAKVTVLAEMVKRHVEEEENVLLAKVDKTFGADTLERLGTDMESLHADHIEEGWESTLARSIPRTSIDDALNVLSPNFSGRPSVPSFS